MTVQSSDEFNPANMARGMLSDEGTGLSREKHATPTLRVFEGDEAQWFEYGGFIGGRQGPGWIERVYRGVLWSEGEYQFRVWRLRIEGDELEKLAQQLGKHVRTVLKVGKEDAFSVRRILIESLPLTMD